MKWKVGDLVDFMGNEKIRCGHIIRISESLQTADRYIYEVEVNGSKLNMMLNPAQIIDIDIDYLSSL